MVPLLLDVRLPQVRGVADDAITRPPRLVTHRREGSGGGANRDTLVVSRARATHFQTIEHLFRETCQTLRDVTSSEHCGKIWQLFFRSELLCANCFDSRLLTQVSFPEIIPNTPEWFFPTGPGRSHP